MLVLSMDGTVRHEDFSDMKFPYRCLRCYQVHDVALVEVVQRYTDCTVWRCPNCQALIDDRPKSMGGSAERIKEKP